MRRERKSGDAKYSGREARPVGLFCRCLVTTARTTEEEGEGGLRREHWQAGALPTPWLPVDQCKYDLGDWGLLFSS